MPEKEKDNGQGTEEIKPLTLFEERMKGLLDELDDHMEQVGGNYGPILMEVFTFSGVISVYISSCVVLFSIYDSVPVNGNICGLLKMPLNDRGNGRHPEDQNRN